MRIVIINKSDSRGGAAVVSRRLMHALRQEGADARMLVAERLTDDPHVTAAAPGWRTKLPFLAERARIFAANGFNRADLFKVDTADAGLPLWKHPLVQQADAVFLNWINQGMLSLRGIERIAARKRIIWTMHDMWCATGICHHAAACNGFTGSCGCCPLLGKRAAPTDVSRRSHDAKKKLYARTDMTFVAVSGWLARRCRESSLLADADIETIPNPFQMPAQAPQPKPQGDTILAVMAAARLDDDIKGLPILADALELLPPEIASRLRIELCGDLRDKDSIRRMQPTAVWRGVVSGTDMPATYSRARLVLSPSLYETLPGTLVEGQACGALPVAFDRGGQSDIITDGVTGVLADFGSDRHQAAANFAEAIVRAVRLTDSTPEDILLHRLRDNVARRFSASAVARRYLSIV